MQTLTIGELARTAHMNLETIRYYEREGLMPEPPRPSDCDLSSVPRNSASQWQRSENFWSCDATPSRFVRTL